MTSAASHHTQHIVSSSVKASNIEK